MNPISVKGSLQMPMYQHSVGGWRPCESTKFLETSQYFRYMWKFPFWIQCWYTFSLCLNVSLVEIKLHSSQSHQQRIVFGSYIPYLWGKRNQKIFQHKAMDADSKIVEAIRTRMSKRRSIKDASQNRMLRPKLWRPSGLICVWSLGWPRIWWVLFCFLGCACFCAYLVLSCLINRYMDQLN